MTAADTATGGVRALSGRWIAVEFGGALVALTIPFLLLPSFPSGDLHSHVYNAWLVPQIERAELPGLRIVPMWTNTLVDRALVMLLRVASPRWCEAIVLIVLAHLSTWSAFLCCRALSRRACWEWLPIVTVVGLGWTFHMGFSNWSLAAGLSLLAAALALSRRPVLLRATGSLGLAAVAVLASPLPVACAAAALSVFVLVRGRRIAPVRVLIVGASAVTVLGAALRIMRRGVYSSDQLWAFSGADQLVILDTKYLVYMVALLVLWAAALRPWLRAVGNEAFAEPAFAVALLGTLSCIVIPDAVWFPGFPFPASLLVLRSTFFVAIAWTAAAARASFRPSRAITAGVIALGWMATASVDWISLARYQALVEAAVATLPPGSRVLSTMNSPGSRSLAVHHAVDRACIGHCFAWANYEPPSAAFRIRADPGNPFVVDRSEELWRVLSGRYRVPDLPFPLWRVHLCPGRAVTLCVSPLQAGDLVALECVDPFVHHGNVLSLARCTASGDDVHTASADTHRR